ncbi:DUF3368 domain-containing protein [Leptolyngbya cf. ectocarpi LEGE 11479]|uniref:DUF3368 domain-containing protein n=1 Tax=Leptolyngbya cf. ectocarpi LEGE 11479 TaxID=1828722 RepID=A0A929FAK1_LEPEC|nr:DUF3368 domain-containing protein [Leptolyngbya ectocarpi]MBE9070041.1 DUF3368 domain-containing protein [Leptolyngbya cf. ectocarpi LEGE 11479]
MIVVSDTSPITNLAAIDHLHLLQQLYGSILIPVAVYDELVYPGKSVPGQQEVQKLIWIQKQPVQDIQAVLDIQSSRANIDRGEAEAIALALEVGASLVLMDERRGRSAGAAFGLQMTGLLGVLLQAKQANLVDTVKPLLDNLVAKANFRVSRALYDFALKSANE